MEGGGPLHFLVCIRCHIMGFERNEAYCVHNPKPLSQCSFKSTKGDAGCSKLSWTPELAR